jgi:metal transporter CNNM
MDFLFCCIKVLSFFLVFTDNRTKVRRQRPTKKQDFTIFAERKDHQRLRISPQLTLATFQYLSTCK